MHPLSVAIVAKDEADRLPDAIRSARFADEIVVLDSGSADDTAALAVSLGARVVHTDWPGFIAQKNRALEHVRHDWVLAIDADERVSPALADSIRAALQRPRASGYQMRRLTWWEGQPVRHGTFSRDWQTRLFRRDAARWVGREPHDRAQVEGPVARLEGELHHHPYRDLGEHLATIDRYAALGAAALHAEGRRAHTWDLLIRPPWHLLRALIWRLGLLDGARGLCLAGLGATHVLLKWARLWMLQHPRQIVDSSQSTEAGPSP